MSEIPISNRISERQAPIILAPYLLLLLSALFLTFVLLVIVLSIAVSFRLGEMMARPNPFTPYQAIWPGQYIANMAEYHKLSPKGHLQCYDESLGTQYPGQRIQITDESLRPPDNLTCINSVEGAVFYYIGIRIQDNRVRELALFSHVLREDTLYICWGAPDAITKGAYGQSYYLHWERSTYTATAMLIKPSDVVSLVRLVAKA